MSVLIRTSDVPSAQRHDAWRGIVCDTLGPLDLRIDPDAPLDGEIQSGRLGGLGVGRVLTSTPHSVHRTAGLIRKDNPDLYRVVLAVSGNPCVAQDGRSTRLSKGEFAIYDFTRPYELAYNRGVQLAVFSVPRDLLGLSIDTVARITALPISSTDGTGALVAPLLRRVAQDVDDYRPASAARLSTVVLNLLTAAVAERADADESVAEPVREHALLHRIHAFVEEHLGEPDLAPGRLAAAHHVSVRYLHRLFQSQGTTMAAWIRHRRLERCRTDLADPAKRAIPVSAVAARWGLPDPAHFSRVFRTTYGMPPAEYRRSCLR